MSSQRFADPASTQMQYELHYKNSEYFGPSELKKSADFMARDPDLWVFRRFEKLHLFNIARIQQHLARLEHDLATQISDPQQAQFDELLPDIQRTLKEYDTALSAQANITFYRHPRSHIVKHMREWAPGNSAALTKGLDIHREGKGDLNDLACIAPGEQNWTHRLVQSNDWLLRIFTKKKKKGNEENGTEELGRELWSTLIYSDESIRRSEIVFLHASFCFLLLSPVCALVYLESLRWKLVVLVFSLLAASVLSAGFLDTPHKSSLALVAGYAAILMVFFSKNASS